MKCKVACTKFWQIVKVLKSLDAPEGVCIIPIGAQGSGKSTLGRRLKVALGDVDVISPDAIRMRLYKKVHPEEEQVDYGKVWDWLTETGKHELVRKLTKERFAKSVARFVYIDQMNLTRRSRRPFLLTDRFKVAVYFHLDEKTLLERHRRRSDKAAHIPEAAVLVNHRKAEEPTEEEGFDLIINYYVDGHKRSLLSKCYTVKKGVSDVQKSIEILEFAMKMELEARDFYRESGDRVARDDVRRLLSRLAEWEESHHRFLKEQRDRLKSGAGWDASAIPLDASEARDILERPWKGRGVEPPLSEEASDFSVIRMALGMEIDFRNFYLKAAANVNDPDGKAVLTKLADWEGEHQKIIDEQYRQLHQDFMAQMGFAPF